MTYEEYGKSAYRHLKAVHAIYNRFAHGDAESSAKREETGMVWAELYYLCGYVIEGVVVYCLFKSNNWSRNDDVLRTLSKHKEKTGADIYSPVRGHRFLEVMNSYMVEDSNYAGVAYLDGSIPLRNEQKRLLFQWDTHLRYDKKIHLDEEQIEGFIELCDKIYKAIEKV